MSQVERSKPTVILKDLDFLIEKRTMNMGPERKNIFVTQVKADCLFLQSLGVMDYSLLLGVHFRDRTAHDADMDAMENGQHEYGDMAPSTRHSMLGHLIKTGSLKQSMPELTHTSDFQQHDGGWCSQAWLPDEMQGPQVTGEEIYFVGIIDYLQYYNNRKRAETFFKGCTHAVQDISAVDPRFYASRFCNFMTSIME